MWHFVFCVGSCHSESAIFVAEGIYFPAWKQRPDLGLGVYRPPPASVAFVASSNYPLRFGGKAHQLCCFPCYRARIGPDTAIEKNPAGACFEQQRGVPETNEFVQPKTASVSCQIPETTQFPPYQGLTARGDYPRRFGFPCAYLYCAHRHKVPANTSPAHLVLVSLLFE